MNFNSGVNLTWTWSLLIRVTASTLSTLVQAGMLYSQDVGSATEKVALENVTVNSDSSNIQFHFKTDDKQFQRCCTRTCCGGFEVIKLRLAGYETQAHIIGSPATLLVTEYGRMHLVASSRKFPFLLRQNRAERVAKVSSQPRILWKWRRSRIS